MKTSRRSINSKNPTKSKGEKQTEYVKSEEETCVNQSTKVIQFVNHQTCKQFKYLLDFDSITIMRTALARQRLKNPIESGKNAA